MSWSLAAPLGNGIVFVGSEYPKLVGRETMFDGLVVRYMASGDGPEISLGLADGFVRPVYSTERDIVGYRFDLSEPTKFGIARCVGSNRDIFRRNGNFELIAKMFNPVYYHNSADFLEDWEKLQQVFTDLIVMVIEGMILRIWSEGMS